MRFIAFFNLLMLAIGARAGGPDGYGVWKGHYQGYDDLTQNLCGGPKRKQSPKNLVEVVECDATHEIRTKCAVDPLSDDDAFEKHIPSNRKNFFSYPYCIRKSLELLDIDYDLLDNLKSLKGTEKLYTQDKMWQKICEECRWEFIASF